MEFLKSYFMLPVLLGCYASGEAIRRVRPTSLCGNDEFLCKSVTRCIPIAWRCDCSNDCDDGSDEEDCELACPTTRSLTTPSTIIPYIKHTTETEKPQKPCPEEGHKLCDDGKACIPALLVCDGVPDCPDGSDEKYGCENSSVCAENFFFCKHKSPIPCVPRDKLCDGVNDCSDGSDESICGKCPGMFCRNGGVCRLIKRAPSCVCKSGYGQNRCGNIIAPNMTSFFNNSGWITSGSIGTILLIVIMFFIKYRRKANTEKTKTAYSAKNQEFSLYFITIVH
ncbi:MAM and LDL-receptor class A domain-containing protein 1-like [Stegodyphus dumicola]|uniref:MAM and LDL-receptor class A domain-containing protein 1-like n=1 Tax=Stegodyphus dumicola TaxID=202533 RepID=UPI0015ADEB64|nr:MAM and LDL-receptor class A domain-containing protein 1-like [Stegodyphus dumicola]